MVQFQVRIHTQPRGNHVHLRLECDILKREDSTPEELEIARTLEKLFKTGIIATHNAFRGLCQVTRWKEINEKES
jgi:hypothetical protein